MSYERNKKIDRRNLIKSAGVAGLSILTGKSLAEDANTTDGNVPPEVPPEPIPFKIPTRKLGKTGVEAPILSLGFGRPGEPVVLKRAIDYGVYHWDTSLFAPNSEASIGSFLAKNPDVRKGLFIVTKEHGSKTPEDVEKCLQTSLARLKTDYIDLYFGVYMVNDPARLTEDARKWAEDAKKRGVIKYFGFSTHENMAKCLTAAAGLDWIDAVMVKYDFRLMQNTQMQEALEACSKAGIGLIAMKTQSMRPRGAAPADPNEAEAEKKMLAHFLDKGFTSGQAKIKAVLEDQRVSTVCSAMSSTAMLMTNIAAVLDKTKLTAEDMDVLRRYAEQTCSGYCAGCADICRPLADGAPVSDVMRALMYHDGYGDVALGKAVFAGIDAPVRRRLLSIDYSAAEAKCPNRMPIGKLIGEAVNKLA